jgi:flagellar motor switch protein FliG
MPPLQTQQKIHGRAKAAMLIMLVGKEAAAKITQRLTADEVEMLSLEIAQLDRLDQETAQSVLGEYVESSTAFESIATGGVDYAREVLEGTYGSQKASNILRRIQSQIADSAGLYRLRQADPQQLSNTLRAEHPQTIAVVLAHLDAPQTAAVLKELGSDVGGEVVFRMARLEKVNPELLQMIERSLRAETDLSLTRGASSAGGPEAVAGVLNLLTGTLEKDILAALNAKDAALCEQIKNFMFVFEDLTSLDDKSIGRLLREVDNKTLALAFKAASDALKDRIKGSMSQRAIMALNDEIDALGPVRLKDVESAQAQIIDQVRKLEEAGEIVIAKAGGDDVVIA